jgi:hypothetical protein
MTSVKPDLFTKGSLESNRFTNGLSGFDPAEPAENERCHNACCFETSRDGMIRYAAGRAVE